MQKEETKGEASKLEIYQNVYAATKKAIKLDKELIKSAIENLKEFSQKKKETAKNLLEEEDDFIHVTITLSEVPLKFSPKPVQIPLKHPIYGSEYSTHACVLVKDPQRKFKDLVQDLEIPCLAKVLGYEKLMKNFKEYKDRRQLTQEFDLFFCDKRIYPMLPKVTGSFFYKKKKFPYPVTISEDGAEIQKTLEDALKCSYMMLGNGPHYSFKVARVSMKPMKSVANIIVAIYKAVPHIIKDAIKPGKIQSITVKTSTSPELPIYTHLSKKDALAYLQGPAKKEKAK